MTLVEGDQLSGQGVLCSTVGGHDPQETARREEAALTPSHQCCALKSPNTYLLLSFLTAALLALSLAPTPTPVPFSAFPLVSKHSLF